MKLVRNILAVLTGAIGMILAVPVFLLALPFWVVSMLTRTIARLVQPKFLTRDQLIQFDPTFGWRACANLNTHHLMGDLFHITTDAEGFRGAVPLDQSDVVVFGDSFAAGYGVGERHLFANLTSSLRIKPVGTGGYSMVQEFLWMQQLQSRIGGKLVVWFIYYGNDLYDNLMPDLRAYRKPFLRETDGGWEIVSSHMSAAKWPIITQGRMQGENHMPKLAELCSDTFIAKRAYPACEYLIRVGKELCDQAGANLVVLGIPDAMQLNPEGRRQLKSMAGDPPSFDATRPDRTIGAMCERMGVDFVAGASFLDVSCYKTNDCHWNEKGHRRVNDMITQLAMKKPNRPASCDQEAMAGALAEA